VHFWQNNEFIFERFLIFQHTMRLNFNTEHTGKNLFFILFLLFFISSCENAPFVGESQEGAGYVITGKILNHQENKKLRFYDSYAGDTAAEYVIEIRKDGSFRYEGSFETATPVLFVYGKSENAVFEQNEKIVIFLADNDSLHIEAEGKNFAEAKISGGKNQAIFQTYNDLIKPHLHELEKDLFKINSEKNQKNIEKLNEKYQEHLRIFLEVSRDYVSQHANTIAGLYIALNALPIEENMSIFEHLVVANKDKKSPWVIKLEKTVEMLKPVSIGAVVPNFTVTDSAGYKISVINLRGRYLLIDFWASWCEPCRKDHKILNQIYSQIGNKDFEILGISLDKERAKWMEAIRTDRTKWLNALADSEADTLMKLFQIQSVPHSILVDREGKIIAKNVRGFAIKSKLDALLGKSLSE
jgi:thiol-disulfide isomerase/thioredoxin